MAPPPAGMPGRAAAVIIGLQAVGCLMAGVLAIAAPGEESLGTGSAVMLAVFILLFALGLGLVARGLWQGSLWPRTGAVVWLVLLLPVAWGFVQADRILVGGLILGSALVGIAAVAAESRAGG